MWRRRDPEVQGFKVQGFKVQGFKVQGFKRFMAMSRQKRRAGRLAIVVAIAVGVAGTADALGPESKRLGRAKDYIADEQWPRAIDELRVAVADPKESRRDEALYWLAHSLNQSGDPASAVETISRLERDFPSSMWVKPARSLRIEIAVRLNRSDVLWWTALPPAPPPAPLQPMRPTARSRGRAGSLLPAPPTPVALPPASPIPPPAGSAKLPPPSPPPPPKIWYPDSYNPDADLRIQALGGLMKTDAEKVIPMLRDIAFESENPGQASRAVFMLAQSMLPKARETVVQVAKTGPERAKLAAVRELGRFGGPDVSKELLQVYTTANDPVKWQIVKSLGERAEPLALFHIVQTEKDGKLRYSAIVSLGRAGGITQLAGMYKSANLQSRRSIIGGLFFARAETELIRIADSESDEQLRQEVFQRLRFLDTPKAKEYLQKVSEKR